MNERLKLLSERRLEQIVEDENFNLDDKLCGSVDVEDGGHGEVRFVCPEVTRGSSIEASGNRISPGVDFNRNLR